MLEHPTSCYIQHSLPTLCLTANRSTVCSRMQRLLPARLSAEGCGTAIFRECPALARMVVPFSINTHCFALHIQLEVAINPTKPPSSQCRSPDRPLCLCRSGHQSGTTQQLATKAGLWIVWRATTPPTTDKVERTAASLTLRRPPPALPSCPTPPMYQIC